MIKPISKEVKTGLKSIIESTLIVIEIVLFEITFLNIE